MNKKINIIGVEIPDGNFDNYNQMMCCNINGKVVPYDIIINNIIESNKYGKNMENTKMLKNEILKPNELKQLNEFFYRIGSLGYNNCLIHSCLKIDKLYMDKNKNAKIMEACNFRKKMFDSFTEEKYNKYFKGELKKASEIDSSFSYKNMKYTLDENKMLGDEYIEIIEDILKVNIYIFTGNLQMRSNFNKSKKYDKNIMLYFINNHYETLAIKKEDNLQLVLDNKEFKELFG